MLWLLWVTHVPTIFREKGDNYWTSKLCRIQKDRKDRFQVSGIQLFWDYAFNFLDSSVLESSFPESNPKLKQLPKLKPKLKNTQKPTLQEIQIELNSNTSIICIQQLALQAFGMMSRVGNHCACLSTRIVFLFLVLTNRQDHKFERRTQTHVSNTCFCVQRSNLWSWRNDMSLN